MQQFIKTVNLIYNLFKILKKENFINRLKVSKLLIKSNLSKMNQGETKITAKKLNNFLIVCYNYINL